MNLTLACDNVTFEFLFVVLLAVLAEGAKIPIDLATVGARVLRSLLLQSEPKKAYLIIVNLLVLLEV